MYFKLYQGSSRGTGSVGLRELRPRIIEEEELDPERDPFSESRGLYANISLGRSSEIRENSPMFDRTAPAGWNPNAFANDRSNDFLFSETENIYKLFKSSIVEEEIIEDIVNTSIARKNAESTGTQKTDTSERKSDNEENTNDRFHRKPKISRAGSVDYGLSVETRETRNKLKRRRCKGRF